MSVLAVVPARFESSRLPGKALLDIDGKPVIVRVWERVSAARLVDRVVVATDHEGIAEAVRAAGGEVMAVVGSFRTGSDRVAAAAARLPEYDLVLNVQGDEPELDPTVVDAVVAAFDDEAVEIATPVAPLTGDPADPSTVKVVLDVWGWALYFSRQPIPTGGPHWHHQGVYGFRADTLARLASLPTGALETVERLEQLRWLEHGHPIRAVAVARSSRALNTPADLEHIRRGRTAS